MESYKARSLPLKDAAIDSSVFYEELIDANTQFGVYKAKLTDSKLNSSWFLPTLQQKEALASSLLEGTQATLDDVFTSQATSNEKDKNMREVFNYSISLDQGHRLTEETGFTLELFKSIHRLLLSGNVRKNRKTIPGEYRTEQNYITRSNTSNVITFIPPKPTDVLPLMENLLAYINGPQDSLRPLVRIAIIHAQFETIHPFMDGNGRVGRILIPLYLKAQGEIELPYFFISEALERDKFKYYTLLNLTRTENNWSEWIKFFLQAVKLQCEKYIRIVDRINSLYDVDLDKVSNILRSSKSVDLMRALYKFPVITTSQVMQLTDMPKATATRYLNLLADNRIIFSDGKKRNRVFYYYELLDVLRG